MVNRLLLRSSARFFTRHPWQLWLTLLSIALGTAVMIAVDLANMTANKSFRHSVSVLSGPMTHEIAAREGEIPEDFYTRLRVQWGLRASTPQVTATVNVAGLQYTLLGLDPLANVFQPQTGFDIPADKLPRLLTEPNSVLIPSGLADKEDIKAGGRLVVTLNQIQKEVTVLAIVDVKDDVRLANLIVTDIATAQNLLGKPGMLSRIQLQLDEPQVAALQTRLPPNLKLNSYQAQQQSFSQMTEAFRINLTAMSLLAMLVGAFLVYNTMTFSVLQRRQAFAIHRMVGTTGAQLFRHMLPGGHHPGVGGKCPGRTIGYRVGTGLAGSGFTNNF